MMFTHVCRKEVKYKNNYMLDLEVGKIRRAGGKLNGLEEVNA